MREIKGHRTQMYTPDNMKAMQKSLHDFQREPFFKLFNKTIVQQMLAFLLSKELLPRKPSSTGFKIFVDLYVLDIQRYEFPKEWVTSIRNNSWNLLYHLLSHGITIFQYTMLCHGNFENITVYCKCHTKLTEKESYIHYS